MNNAVCQLYAAHLVRVDLRSLRLKSSEGASGRVTAEVIKFQLTTLGELCLQFPIDPLMAKVLLMSSVLGHFEETLRRVSFLSTTESLMNLSFDSKQDYYREKIKIGESQTTNSDFECWFQLFKFKKHLFHRKALNNISKIEDQLNQITQRIPKTKIFFALCKDSVFIHLLLKALKSFERGTAPQIEALFEMMGTRICRNVGLLCALDKKIFKALGLKNKFKKVSSRRDSKVDVVEWVTRKTDRIRRKVHSKPRASGMRRIFREGLGDR